MTYLAASAACITLAVGRALTTGIDGLTLLLVALAVAALLPITVTKEYR